MNETKFWNPSSQNKGVANPMTPKTGKSKLVKSLGVGGVVLLSIIGVLGLLLFIFVVKPSYEVIQQVKKVESDVTMVKEALANRDLVSFETSLDSVEKDLKDLKIVKDKNYGWTQKFSYTRPYFQDSDAFINAGLHGVSAGREFARVVLPFADALGLRTNIEQEVTELGLAEAFAAWIAAMPVVAEDSDGIIKEINLIGEELAKVDASRYPESFRGIVLRSSIENAQNSLSQVNEFAPDIKTALNVIPAILGVGSGEKRYMIIMQNDKEIRATGGFWTYMATFKVNNALLNSDFTSYNSYYVDDVLNVIDAYHTFPKVPAAYEKHLKVERMFARDANTSPDLPTSVDQFLNEFWNTASGIAPNQIKTVDGVFVIDTKVLEEMLEVTGPATVNGVTYTKDNVVLELETLASLKLAEQLNRKKILGDLMEAMLVNVFESDRNLWPKLVDKGVDLAVRKHVAAYVFDPDAQALLEKYNLAGRIVDPVVGDYAFVVQTNLGGDKTNWFTNKEVTHTLDKEGERWLRTVKIKYTYTQPAPEFGAFVKRFRDWVRVYVPAGSELVGVEGSQDETGQGEERNKTYFHGYVELGPNESHEITFKYYLPNDVITGSDYKLYIQKQVSIDSEVHNVVVNGEEEKIELKYDKKYTKAL